MAVAREVEAMQDQSDSTGSEGMETLKWEVKWEVSVTPREGKTERSKEAREVQVPLSVGRREGTYLYQCQRDWWSLRLYRSFTRAKSHSLIVPTSLEETTPVLSWLLAIS